jgi:predicted anti-sigma-YlaC factor YlaD
MPGDAQSHVATCAACRELQGEMAALRSALRALPHEPLPPAALEAVWRETVRARPAASTFWRAAAAAAIVTAFGAGTIYFVTGSLRQAELARAEAQAELVLGYTARALAATRAAATHQVIQEKVSPAVRGKTTPRPPRRTS